MPATLLPPTATDLERRLEQAAAHYESGRDVPIDTLWRPGQCPEALLPWLAWALGVRVWAAEWSVDVKRAVITASVPLHRMEGTLGAVRTHLDALGAVYEIEERPGGVAFSARIVVSNTGELGARAAARLRAQIEDVSRLSVEFVLVLTATATLALPVACAATAVVVADFGLAVDVS